MKRRLQSDQARAISHQVIMSRLFAIFIAISLLLGPLAMDRAMAAVPPPSHAQMANDAAAIADHCKSDKQDKSHKPMSKPCCAAMCATAAVMPEMSAHQQMFDRLLAISAPASVHRGILAEIATPPPRAA